MTINRIHKSYFSGMTKILITSIFSFEAIFILFLFAGRYKADQRFEWVPVDLTALFFVLSVIVGLYILFHRKFRVKRKSVILVGLGIIFVAYVVMSLMWTPGHVYANQKAFYIATLVLWPLIACALVIAYEEERIRRFFILLMVFSGWIAIESTMSYIDAGGYGFVTTLGGNYLGIGRVLSIGAIIAFAYSVFLKNSLLKRAVGFAVFVFYIFLLLVVGGRGPLLATFFAMLVPLFLGWRISSVNGIKFKRYIIPITIAITIIVGALIYFLVTGHVMTSVNRLLVLLTPGMGDSAGTRMMFYNNAFAFWKDKFLLGYGIGSWPIINNGVDTRGYPHNLILEIMVELGLMGLLLFAILIIAGLRIMKSMGSIRNDPMKLIIIMIFVNLVLNAMVSGDIPDNRFLFADLGLMCFVHKGKFSEKPESV